VGGWGGGGGGGGWGGGGVGGGGWGAGGGKIRKPAPASISMKNTGKSQFPIRAYFHGITEGSAHRGAGRRPPFRYTLSASDGPTKMGDSHINLKGVTCLTETGMPERKTFYGERTDEEDVHH